MSVADTTLGILVKNKPPPRDSLFDDITRNYAAVGAVGGGEIVRKVECGKTQALMSKRY